MCITSLYVEGSCLACGYNTKGEHCELCLDGFEGSGIYRNCSLSGTLISNIYNVMIYVAVSCG